MLIPVPFGVRQLHTPCASRCGLVRNESCASLRRLVTTHAQGVLIVGEQSIVYYNGTTARDVAVSGMSIKAYGRMDKDGSRYLLGDHIGGLHALVLKHEGGVVSPSPPVCQQTAHT